MDRNCERAYNDRITFLEEAYGIGYKLNIGDIAKRIKNIAKTILECGRADHIQNINHQDH